MDFTANDIKKYFSRRCHLIFRYCGKHFKIQVVQIIWILEQKWDFLKIFQRCVSGVHFRNNKILGKLFKEHEQNGKASRIEMVCLWTKSPHFWDLTRITGISDSFSCFSLQLWVKNRTKRSMLAQNRSATILLSHWGLNMTVSELIELHAKICSKSKKISR